MAIQEDGVSTTGRNWAGNYAYQATRLHEPASLDELRAIVARTPKIHTLGSRHCFNDIADSAELITLDGIDQNLVIDREAMTVSMSAGIKYGDLAQALECEGLALHNMASLPHISVGGAVATATHGSGDANGNLSTAVAALELVTSEGDIVHLARGDEDFAGAVVNVGALGVVTRLTLDVQPTFQVQQQVFEGLAWDVLYENFDAITSSAYSVSLFIDYGETVGQVWRKSRVDPQNPQEPLREFFGAPAAPLDRHPVPTLSAEGTTEQIGIVGAWADRLPHFRMDSVPASGNEIQTEFMVARPYAIAAIKAVREIAPVIQPYLWVSEIRTVAADDFWLSSAYGTDTVCIHFSLRHDQEAVDRLLPIIEATLAPFNPRPHWGKVFVATASDLEPRYERLSDFRNLASRLDPRGAFRNAYLDRHVFG
ncbi:MAG: D-arabinono-1,4-lactone oxidase [Thermomicrobiales bacterium]